MLPSSARRMSLGRYYHIGLKKEIVPTKYADRGGIGGHKRNNQNNVITVMDPETGKIGFYRIDGKKIADTLYDESVEAFSDDLAPVYEMYSERTGMINIEGELVYDYIFDSMTLPYNGPTHKSGQKDKLDLNNNLNLSLWVKFVENTRKKKS